MGQAWLRTTFVMSTLVALPTLAAAQFPPPPPPVQDRWPQIAAPERPVQTQPARPAQTQPAPADRPQQQAAAPTDAAAAPPKPKAAVAPSNAVACSGVFGKESAHLKLAMRYDSRNVVFTEVDGPDGTRLNATVIYPHDPKKRLEVLWNNEAGRSDTQLIAINGQSQWTAPKGLKLGLALAALEKANGRPFKLSGFDKDGFAAVAGWEGGALSTLPGGCRIGVRMAADRKAPDAAREALSGDKEIMSNDPAMRAVKPVIAEVLIGY